MEGMLLGRNEKLGAFIKSYHIANIEVKTYFPLTDLVRQNKAILRRIAIQIGDVFKYIFRNIIKENSIHTM